MERELRANRVTVLAPSKRCALIRAAVQHNKARRMLRARPRAQPALWVDGTVLARTVGRALRAARLARGLTQHDVARALGTHRPIVARTEAGRHMSTLDRITRHALVVGLTLDDLGALIDASVC